MINADDLVNLFRAEAAKRHQPLPDSPVLQPRLMLPPIRHLPEIHDLIEASGTLQRNGSAPKLLEAGELEPVPRPTWWRTVDPKTPRLQELVRKARAWSAGSKKLPKFIRALSRKQGRYNDAIAESVGTLTKANEQLTKQVQELTAAFKAQSTWLQTLADRRVSDLAAVREAARGAAAEAREAEKAIRESVAARLGAVHADLAALRNALEPLTADLQERVNTLAQELHRTRLEVSDRGAEVREVHWNFLNVLEDVTTLSARLKAVAGDLAGFSKSQEDRTAGIAELQRNDSASLRTAVSRLEDRLISEAVYLKAQLSLLRTSPAHRAASAPAEPDVLPPGDAATAQQFDAFYLAFENQFRGESNDIRRRLEVYLPFLAATGASEGGGVVDLGCGRGEWLELMREREIGNASGVDLNSSMVEWCVGLGLSVVNSDALAYLRSLPDNSLAAITSFHLIEHLPFPVLMDLLHEILRALRPGGCTILETPNPRNILVGASDFYRDMTHERPLHPDTMRFTLETIGFADVGCFFLEDGGDGRTAIRRRDYMFTDLQSYVDVPRDYAVIARKA